MLIALMVVGYILAGLISCKIVLILMGKDLDSFWDDPAPLGAGLFWPIAVAIAVMCILGYPLYRFSRWFLSLNWDDVKVHFVKRETHQIEKDLAKREDDKDD